MIQAGSRVVVKLDNITRVVSYRQPYIVERIVDKGPEPIAECFFADKTAAPVWLVVSRLEELSA